MEVILRTDIPKLGKAGDVVKVKMDMQEIT